VSNPGSGGGGSRTLSRDFKHVKRHGPAGGSQAFSGWMGLGVGLAVGLSVALGVFLHYRGQPEAEPQAEPKPAPKSDVASEVPAPDSSDSLTFYDILKNQEVEVPADPATKPGAGRPNLPRGEVTLQAGSFKQSAEAGKLQATLATLGIDAKIKRFAMEDETWYRVQIGPIATVQELDAIRAKLADAEIETTPVTPTGQPPPP
jgi:cell division septation protein DedD